MAKPSVTIIIPCKRIDGFVRECMKHCLKLGYSDYRILLLTDGKEKSKFPKTTVIPTGPVFPSVKRNIGVRMSKSSICAFIDSDAYPPKDWLSNAVKIMADKSIGAVGGPNLIPSTSPLKEQVANDIIFSRLGVGAFQCSATEGKICDVREVPASNLIVRRSVLEHAEGFDETLLTGEDAKLCFQTTELGYRVVYSPDLPVYHHRRPLWKPYLQSVWVYGRDKAYLLKELFSLSRIFYFIPGVFVLWLMSGLALSLIYRPVRFFYITVWAVYIVAILVQSLAFAGLKRRALVLVGVPLTHIAYGLGFWYGLLSRRHR